MAKANELVTFDTTKYPALVGDTATMLRGNLQGETITPADLNRIKCPSAGGTMWSIPGPAGETAAAEVEGVIIHIGKRRAYWSNPDPSGDPPDCSSTDCIHGFGNPGGECAHCPLSQYGSATKRDGTAGRGQACCETRLVFVLREGSVLPDVISIPPGSLKYMKKHLISLQVPYYTVLTKFTLNSTKNKDGTKYSEIIPKVSATLPLDVSSQILAYAKSLEPVFSGTNSQQDEVQ